MTGTRYFGKYRATVLDNDDPQSLGRIRCQLAHLDGPFPSTATPWALPSFPFAGEGMSGIVALPAVGSLVWVEFEAGDPDYPIWSGSFWGRAGNFPAQALDGATPATPNIHLQTTTGTSVTLSDNPAQQVLIKTAAGALISIGADGITISNGQGASIVLSGPSVIINGGALSIT